MATAAKNNGTQAPQAADVSAQIEVLQADIAALTKTVSGFAKGKGVEVRDRAAVQAERLGAEASAAAEQATDMVRENPGTALGVAAAVGFMVGYLTSRR